MKRFPQLPLFFIAMVRLSFWQLPVAIVVLGTVAIAFAQSPGKPVRRAEKPKFEKATVDTFYSNAVEQGLTGPRPNLGQAVASKSPTPGGNTAGPAEVGSTGSGTGWSSIISGQTIEDSIKSLKLQADSSVTTPSDFAGKGYKNVRRDFSVLAMLFGIAGDYDGEVRFKKDAPAARDVFARTAANAKVGTQQVFNEAKQRKSELNDLVSGTSPFTGKEADRKPVWNTICDRAPLMQHLESIYEPRLKPNLANEGQFKSNSEDVLRDAEVIAAIGKVMMADGMEDADAEDYKKFCEKLVKAGKDIADGVKLKNFQAASGAGAEIGKACTECHENYRS